MNTSLSFKNLSEVLEYLTACGVDSEIVDYMGTVTKQAGSQISVRSPFSKEFLGIEETNPSFVLNCEKALYFDHSIQAANGYEKGKVRRGGHINQLVVALGGSVAEYTEGSPLLERYAELVMAKYSCEFNISARKPIWTKQNIVNNSAIGYDEERNALVFFTFAQAGRDIDEMSFKLSKHAMLYPLHPGAHQEWVDLTDANAARPGGIQGSHSFISHQSLTLKSAAAETFSVPTDELDSFVLTEGEPDAITVSMFGKNVFGASWKNYRFPELFSSTPTHVLSDFGAEAPSLQAGLALQSLYTSVKVYDFLELAAGVDVDDLSEELDVTITRRNLKQNYDITNYLEESENPFDALSKYLLVSGRVLDALNRAVSADTTLPLGLSDEAARIRQRITESFTKHAAVNSIIRGQSGGVQDRVVSDFAGTITNLMARTTFFYGYFAGYGDDHSFVQIDFPCPELNETLCNDCFVYKSRTDLSTMTQDMSTVWLDATEPKFLSLKMLPDSNLERYEDCETESQRRNFLSAFGVVCGHRQKHTAFTTQKFWICIEDVTGNHNYETVSCVALDEKVEMDIVNRKPQELFKISGYYNNDGNIFVVCSVEPTDSDVLFKGEYKGRFLTGTHSSYVKLLEDCREAETPSELILATFEETVTIFEYALGSVGFLDRNFLSSIIVSLFSSCFVGKFDLSLHELKTRTEILDGSDTFYLGHSLYIMGEVSSGKSETIARLSKIFSGVKSRNYSDIKATMFRPAAMQVDKTAVYSFEIGDASGGLMAFDGVQSNRFKTNPFYSAKNLREDGGFSEGAKTATSLSFEWLDTPLQRGTVAAQGLLATSRFGKLQLLCATPLIFTGNFTLETENPEIGALQSFYNFCHAINANVVAATKRIAPLMAKRGIPSMEIPDFRAKDDALFLLQDLKLQQMQSSMFIGHGDQLFSEAQSNVILKGYLKEVVGRRALSIANMFRILRGAKFIRSSDLNLAVSLIQDENYPLFKYADIQLHLADQKSKVAKAVANELQTHHDYDPEGTPFGIALAEIGRETAKEYIRSLFKVAPGGKFLDVDELQSLSNGAEPVGFFGLKPNAFVKMANPLSYQGKSRVLVTDTFVEAVNVFVKRID